MTAGEVVRYLDDYRASFAAPVQTETTVESVTSTSTGFVVETNQGPWGCRSVVVATGACSTPKIPAVSSQLPGRVSQLAAIHYRNPEQLDDGPVLVVGASASGAQIADELTRAGRDVTLAVGEHVRLPRTYRGRDIHWWMDAIGQLDERYDQMDDIVRARRLPSLQLIGSPEKRTLDLNALARSGVSLVGRLAGVASGKAQLSGSLANVCAAADLKQARLLDLIDDHAAQNLPDADLGPPHRPEPTSVGTSPTVLDLDAFDTVIWATGFKPEYPWLDPRSSRSQGSDPPRRRGDGSARHVPAWDAVHPSSQVELPRRGRPRRTVSQ